MENMHEFEQIESNTINLLIDIRDFLQKDMPDSEQFIEKSEYLDLIDYEIEKVKKQELTLAVIATMKSGKSTFLNALIGKKFLPSHDRPMTVIPTEVVLKKDITTVRLILSDKFKSYIQKLINQIRLVPRHDASKLLSSSGYTNLLPFIELIFEGGINNILNSEEDTSESVLNKLKIVNHIIRISIITGGTFEDLPDVPRIEAPFIPFDNIPLSEHVGQLVLVDTPGENESLLTNNEIKKLLDSNFITSNDAITNRIDKLQSALTSILTQQLQKASVCIGLMNYASQNDEASINIISKFAINIGQRGPEQLFIILNQYDRKDKSDESSGIEEFKKDFAARFEGTGFNPDKQIYPLSALYASEVRNYKSEIQQKSEESILLSHAYKQLISCYYPKALADRFMKSPSIEIATDTYENMWKESLFESFLTNVFQKLINNALPISLKSALEVCKKVVTSISTKSGILNASLSEEKNTLLQKIASIKSSLFRLENQRNKINTINKKKELLHERLKSSISTHFVYATNVPNEIYDVFGKEECFTEHLTGIRATFNQWTDSGTKVDEIKDKLVKISENNMSNLTQTVIASLRNDIENYTDDIFERLEEDTTPIIDEINRELNKKFKITNYLELPKGKMKAISINTAVSFSTPIYIEDNLIYDSKHKKICLKTVAAEYVKKIDDLRMQFDKEVNRIVEVDFQNALNKYFKGIDDYISEYKKYFDHSIETNELDIEAKKKLEQNLNLIIPKCNDLINKIDREIVSVSYYIKK